MYSPITITCRVHGDFIQTPANHIFAKSHCPKCPKCNTKPTTREFIERAERVHGNKYIYNKVTYSDAHTPVFIICKLHGGFLQNPTHHISGKQGCPICKESKGEKFVSGILNAMDITYVKQKTFADCRNPLTRYPLKYDFYLPGFNILIEYNGEQHYRTIRRWHGDKTKLKIIQDRDNLKREYAAKRGYTFLVLKYDDKNIKQTLLRAVA